MVRLTKVSTRLARGMVREFTIILPATLTSELGRRTKSADTVNTEHHQTVAYTSVSSLIMSNMDMESLPIKLVSFMKVHMLRTNDKALESIPRQVKSPRMPSSRTMSLLNMSELSSTLQVSSDA